jgi:hypothetical protein
VETAPLTSDKPSSSAAAPEPLPQYRTVSTLAVLALLLGLASPLTLATPLLLAASVIAIVVSGLALRQIAANREIYSGQSLALCGLFLGVLFLAYTPVRLWLRYERLNSKAEQLAEEFLNRLQAGKYFEAQQLARLKFVLPKPGEQTSGRLTDADFDEFKATSWMKNIAAINHQFTYRLDGLEPMPRFKDGDVLVMRYMIVPAAGIKKKPFPLWIHVTRVLDPKTHAPFWKIAQINGEIPREL